MSDDGRGRTESAQRRPPDRKVWEGVQTRGAVQGTRIPDIGDIYVYQQHQQYSDAIVYMDGIRLNHNALSDEDIGTILGGNAKIIRYSELSHISDLDELLTKDLDYCIILY